MINPIFHGLYLGFASEQNAMSADVLKKAYEATEDGFFSVVTKQWPVKPQIAAVGSCCLVGVICGGMLYVANVGDSRVVLGRHVKATGEVLAVQLSAEHNVSIESVRKELQSMHPEDRHIVVLKHNVWRVKGLIQVCILYLRTNLLGSDFVRIIISNLLWYSPSSKNFLELVIASSRKSWNWSCGHVESI